MSCDRSLGVLFVFCTGLCASSGASIASAKTLGTPSRSGRPSRTPQAGTERWAGHQRVEGQRNLTLLGNIETRTDSYVLADVRREGDRVYLTQRTCRVSIAKAAGVQASISDATARRLPPVSIELQRIGDRRYRPASWVSRWDASDHDGDGEAGVTVTVDAPLCGGSLYVSSVTTTRAMVQPYADAIEAWVDVMVEQTILDTSNVCLDLTASDTVERVTGRVQYVAVDTDASCESLVRSGWPVTLPEPS